MVKVEQLLLPLDITRRPVTRPLGRQFARVVRQKPKSFLLDKLKSSPFPTAMNSLQYHGNASVVARTRLCAYPASCLYCSHMNKEGLEFRIRRRTGPNESVGEFDSAPNSHSLKPCIAEWSNPLHIILPFNCKQFEHLGFIVLREICELPPWKPSN